MNSNKRTNLFFDTMFFYGLTIAFTKTLGLVMVMLFSRNVNPGAFGKYDMAVTFFNLMGVLGMAGMNSAMFRNFFDKKETSWQRKVVLNSIYITGILTIGLFLLLYFTKNSVGVLFLRYHHWEEYYNIGLVYMLLSNLTLMLTATLYRIQNARRKIIINMIVVAILNFLAGYYFFVIKKSDAIYLMYIQIGVALFEILLSLYNNRGILFKELVKFDLTIAKDLLKVGIPLAPEGVMFWVLTANSRILIGNQLGIESLGVYAMSNKISAIVNVVQIIFSQSFGYFAYVVMKDSDADKLYGKIFNMFVILCSAIMFSIAIFSELFFKFFIGPNFYEGYKIAAFLAVAPVFTILGSVAGIGIQITKKTYYRTIIMIILGAFNITCSYIFIPYYGLMGAAVVLFLSYLLSLVLNIFIGRKLFFITINYMRLIVTLLLFVLLVYLKTIYTSNIFYDCLILTLSLGFLWIISHKDLSMMYQYLLKRFYKKKTRPSTIECLQNQL